MLGKLLRQSTNQITLTLKQTIVIRPQKPKSIFDTTSYNPEWIPRQNPYHKLRKPKLQMWTDTNAVGPYLIPPIRKRGNPQTYVKQVIEEQQKQRSMRKKLYILDPIRAGDIVDITYQQTLESQTLTTNRGFVVSFKRRNQLTAAIQMVVRMGGMNIKAVYLVHSPKIKDIKLISKGSGNLRSSLKHRWRKIGKNDAHRPRIRNRVMKSRTGAKHKTKQRKISSMDLDKVKSDNVKRILKL